MAASYWCVWHCSAIPANPATSLTGPSVARPVSHCNLSAHQPVAEIVQAGEPISPRFCALSPPSDRLDRHVAFFSPFGALLNDAIRASHGRLSARIRSRPRWAPGDHPEGRIDSENARVSGRGPSASSGISPPKKPRPVLDADVDESAIVRPKNAWSK